MAPNPNGYISFTTAPAIKELGLSDYYNSGHITMKLRFYDGDYKRVQNAVTGNNGFTSPPGFPMQAHFQIPPYIVRVFRKQRNTQTIGNPNQLWVSYSSFNDSTYYEKNDNYFDTAFAKDIGVPLTPYFFYYNLAGNGPYTWDWNYLAQFDSFSDPQNNEHTVYFDSHGRGYLSGGSAARAQVVRRYSNNNTGTYAERNLDGIQNNNSFDYGGYLVCLIRTAISNQNYNVNNQTDITGYQSKISCAYTYRMPPAPILNYNSSTDVVSFTFNTYGSVNLTYQGVPYISDSQNYQPNFEVTTTGSFTNNSYRNYNGTISRNNIYWADDVTTSSYISDIRSYVNQYDKTINIRGAFEFDWSYTNNSSGGNFVIAYSSANFNGSNDWNNVFGLSYVNYYNNSGVNSDFASSNILNNGQKNQFQTTSSTYSVASFYSSITFNTELVNISNQYLFRSYWTEPQGINLTSNVVSYPYTLRLYKKSTSSTDPDLSYKYRLGAVTPYNYVNQSITGLSVSTNWDGSYYMNIYTDKNGNIWYGSPPISGFTGWTASEVEGAYIMVLQRNFTATATSGVNLSLQGSYVINIPNAYLTYTVNPTTGDITNYYMTDSVFYADATNTWKVNHLIKNQSYKVAPSNWLVDLNNITGTTATITDIDDVYPDETKYNTFTFSVLNNNGILVNKSYTFNGDNYSADQNSYLPTRVYSGAGRAYLPPFYDTSKNLITEYPGIDWSTFQSVTLDLTKPIQFQYINAGGDNCLVLATSTGQSGNTYNATFNAGTTLTLHNIQLTGTTETDSIGFTMDGSTRAQVVNSYYLNGVLFPSGSVLTEDKYFYPPFVDNEGKILDTYPGINISTGTSVTIDLRRRIRFYNLNGNVGVMCFDTGGTQNATFNLSATIYSLHSYKSKRFFFERNGNNGTILSYAYIRKDAYSNNQQINLSDLPITLTPPFYNDNGNYLRTVTGEDFNGNPVTVDLTKQIILGNTGGLIFLDAFDTNGNLCGFTKNTFYGFTLGNVFSNTGVINNNITNYFNVGSGGFAENLFFYGYYNVTNLTNQPGNPTTYTTNSLLIYPQPIDLNTEIVQIGSEYLFHSYWEDIYVDYLTDYLTDASYVLRLYKKDVNSTETVEESYLAGPVTNYSFSDISNSGLKVLPNWKTTSPYMMDIYTDKDGNIFYNSPPANDGAFVGWTANEVQNAWFMVLQQNYTNSPIDPLLLENQACYAIDVSTNPTLTRLNDVNGIMTQLVTGNTTLFADASNIWSVYEYDTTNTIGIPGLISNPIPTRTQLNAAYPLRVGPGSITNRIINYFNVGSTFTEKLDNYYVITSISGEAQTLYDVSTNSVNIYDIQQINNSAYNLSKVKFTFNTYDVSKVYFDIWFDDPDASLLRPEAYDINIFKKTQGTGTALSQWYPGGQLSPYIWQSDANRGVTILRTDVPTELEKYKIDASGTVLKYGQGTPADLSGSFETGGYIVTFRRNFYKGTATEPNAKEPFYTLNSQYVYVPPSQTTTYYTIPILDSSNLTLEDNSQTTERLELTTPIYNSYAPDGSVDINFNVYASFDEASFTPKWQPISLYDVSLNYAYVNVRDLYFDFYGLGNGFFYFEVSYNWFAPSQMSLPIGEIGGIYPTIYPAENNPDLSNVDAPFTYQKLGQTEYVLPNIAITNTIELNLPVDSSFARLNEVKELQAEFIGTDTTRMLAIKWREPNVNNLNTTYTGFPYALRLYKKKKDGYTANDQWYDRDASGTAGVYPYRWIPDYFNPNPNNYTYDGVEISANFFPQITTGNYLYFFADASGTVYYNNYPDDLELQNVKPFTEPGGYILIVQRHYTDLSGDNVFTTFGQYLSFIPFSSTNPWSLDDTEYPIITSNPNPYSSFDPMIEGGRQNLQFYWTLEIPNINYNEIVPGQDASGINIVKSIQEPYRNRGKEAYLTSYVTYDFGLSTRPFVERYPLLRINGDPYYTTPSQQYTTNLCSTGVPLDPPEWPRFRPECLDATPEEREAYQMRRKAETLFHVQNRNDMRTNRKNWFSFVAKGYNQKHQTYATQTDKYTNPNTKNYPVVGGGVGLTLPGDCPKKALTAPSYSSDVPGPTVPLTYDPNVPLINYKVFRTYTNSETEYTEKDKN